MGSRDLGQEKPFLSSSKIIENYGLLVKYMEKCRRLDRGCEQLLPTSDILAEIEKLAKQGLVGFEDVVSYIEKKMSTNIDCDICVQSYREVYGLDVDCDRAKKTLLVQLAGWLVEILDSLGYIKIRYSWKP